MMTRLLFVLALTCSLGGRASAQSAAEMPVEPSMGAPVDTAGEELQPMDYTGPEPVTVIRPDVEPLPMAAPEPAPQPAPAPAPAAVAAEALAVASESVEGEAGEDAEPARCALGDLCIGPVLSLGAINPLGFGLHARYGEYLGFGVDYQFLPTLTFSSASASWSLITVEARVYPFGGSFFVGGGFGYQSLNAGASMTDPAGGVVSAEGSVGVPALKLGLGFMGKSGFVFGIDLGFNVPLASTEVEFAGIASSASPETMANLRQQIRDAAETGIDLAPFIPQLNLLRFGYLF